MRYIILMIAAVLLLGACKKTKNTCSLDSRFVFINTSADTFNITENTLNTTIGGISYGKWPSNPGGNLIIGGLIYTDTLPNYLGNGTVYLIFTQESGYTTAPVSVTKTVNVTCGSVNVITFP